jgi:benzoylformate decarboxylase
MNLYNIVGVANAVAMLYSAHKSRSPIVVTASQLDQTIRYGTEGIVDGDTTPLVQQVTRYSEEVHHVSRVSEIVTRAFKMAGAPPAPGPTFVSLPSDVMEQEGDVEISNPKRFIVPLQLSGDFGEIERAAKLLLSANSPLIIAGGQVTRHHAIAELIELAELLAIPVAFERGVNDRLSFPPRHYCCVNEIRRGNPFVNTADVVLAVGSRLHHDPARIRPMYPESAALIYLNLEPEMIAMKYPADVAIMADPRSGLRTLTEQVRANMNNSTSSMVELRRKRLRDDNARAQAELHELGRRGWGSFPMKSWQVAQEIEKVAGNDAIILSELATNWRAISQYMSFSRPETYFADPGGCLGWGVAAAAGMKLARPNEKIIACVGDGAFLFGLQALWTIANYRIPTVTVILNNGGSYSTRRMVEKHGLSRTADGSPIGDFPHDVASLSRISEGFGIWSKSITRAEDFAPTLAEALSSGQPAIIDVPVSRDSSIDMSL